MQSEMADAASQTFRQLTDADFKFGMIKNEQGEAVELSHSSFSALLHSPKRAVRREGLPPVLRAVRRPREHACRDARRLDPARCLLRQGPRLRPVPSRRPCFPDNIPTSVYDNLIAAVHAASCRPSIAISSCAAARCGSRKSITTTPTCRFSASSIHEATHGSRRSKTVVASLEPLGSEYCECPGEGPDGPAWCDRYPNRGKQSGAFSCGTFDGDPYILMNYQPDGARPRLHARPRSGALDAQLLLGRDISRFSITTM